jgi:hypothetical protein
VAREIRLIKALTVEGYWNGAGKGKGAIPHHEWATFAVLPRVIGKGLTAEMEAAGIPTIQIRAVRPDDWVGPRPYELLIPAGFEDGARERFGEALQRAETDAAEARREAAAAITPARD